jgi:Flp pilus assembly protein TadG
MSIVMPVLILVLIGTLELGAAFKDLLAVSQSAREGARVAAFAGNDAGADCSTLQGVIDYLPGQVGDLDDIQIYKVDNAGNQIAGKTNTYSYISGDPTDCANWAASVLWAPTSRQTTAGTTPLDIIGVRVRLDRSWITGFPPFSGSYVVDEDSINRMEPEAFG